MQRLVLFIVSLITVAVARPSYADESSATREDQLKAAYVFNFVKFVQWHDSALGDVLTVCFVGARGVHAAFASGIEAKRAGRHRLAARVLKPADEVSPCHALYVEASAARDVTLSRVSDLPILTVSDASAFAHNGGIIELFADGNRLQFNINVANAQRSGLKISSSLLQLAAVVEKEGL